MKWHEERFKNIQKRKDRKLAMKDDGTRAESPIYLNVFLEDKQKRLEEAKQRFHERLRSNLKRDPKKLFSLVEHNWLRWVLHKSQWKSNRNDVDMKSWQRLYICSIEQFERTWLLQCVCILFIGSREQESLRRIIFEGQEVPELSSNLKWQVTLLLPLLMLKSFFKIITYESNKY